MNLQISRNLSAVPLALFPDSNTTLYPHQVANSTDSSAINSKMPRRHAKQHPSAELGRGRLRQVES